MTLKVRSEQEIREALAAEKDDRIPDLCGWNGTICRAETRGYFTMLCSECPVKKQIEIKPLELLVYYNNLGWALRKDSHVAWHFRHFYGVINDKGSMVALNCIY